MIDIRLTLNQDLSILSIDWESILLERLYAKQWRKFIGDRITDIPQLQINLHEKIIIWKNHTFAYVDEITADGKLHFLLKENKKKPFLYEHTLDLIQDGIQIYDNNGFIIYMNTASRKISNVPTHLDLRGMHLLDLYNVSEEISTTMTCLRTSAPVINRVDNFKSTVGDSIITVNSAYPIIENNVLLGAMVFEQDLQTINKQIARLEETKEIIRNKAYRPIAKFNGYHLTDLIGESKELTDAISLAKKIATNNCHVFLIGETGTGKEIFAQGIHKASDRKHKNFIAINCAAVPETLIESVFFGTTKGSFTGSIDKSGLLEEANGGTLFLDELNSMSLSMQSKLLRVIQEGFFRRVGASKDIQTDIRFISSCNQDPSMLIENNIMRRDLFHRLATISIDIPPLRARKDDIELLVSFYLSKSLDHYAKSIEGISDEVLALFKNYDWPGNVRELFNVLDYVLNTLEETWIHIKNLPRSLQKYQKEQIIDACTIPPIQDCNPLLNITDTDALLDPTIKNCDDLKKLMDHIEKRLIEKTLENYRFNVTKTATKLNLSRQNLQYRMKKLGIS